jgi:hypothetical protein
VDIDGDALTLSVLTSDATAAPASNASKAASDASASKPAATTTITTSVTSKSEDSDASSGSSSSDSGADQVPPAAEQTPQRTVHRRERGGEFAERTLRMPDSANLDAVNAELVEGVLTVTVPKRDEAVTKRRQVPVA